MGLGDALKRAGLVGDKDLRRAKREKKRDEIDAGLRTRRESELAQEAERRARQEAELERRAAQREQELAREAARLEHEAQLRVAQIAGANDLTERPARFHRPFYFVARGGKILKVLVSAEMRARLRAGGVGVVERADGAEVGHALVERAHVERVAAIDPEAVRFHNAGGGDYGDHGDDLGDLDDARTAPEGLVR